MTRYKPNFITGLSGNKLPKGKNLVIKIDDKPLYVLGRLFVRQFFGRKKLIQIEQTGSPRNPESNKLTFETKRFSKRKLEDFPPGKYRVSCYGYFPGLGGKRWADNFEIE